MAKLSKVEATYLYKMIDHHLDAVKMSKKLLADTTPSTRLAKVGDLARGIIDAQTTEIRTMRKWLMEAGYPADSGEGDM